MKKLLLILLVSISTYTYGAIYYVSSSTGNDNNSGLSEELAWASLTKVNSTTFTAGDRVRLKRGDVFRGSIYQTESGTASNYIVYESYGTGAKPLILGSKDISATGDWTLHSGNIWKTSATLGTTQNDISNLIFNNEASCGYKKKTLDSLNAQGKFFYNTTDHLVYLYSVSNPGTYYTHIEAAGHYDIQQGLMKWYNCNYIKVVDLDVRYSSAAGIEVQASNGIIIEYCETSYIGGEWLDPTGASLTRLGNGISIVQTNDSVTVRYCKMHQCFDAGLSPQAWSTSQMTNMWFYGNDITNCYYSYEFWCSTGYTLTNVHFYGNTCTDAGDCWSYPLGLQRYDSYPNASHIITWSLTGTVSNVTVRNNVLLNCANYAYRLDDNVSKIVVDYNDVVADTIGYTNETTKYTTMASWAAAVSQDAHSITADPLFVSSTDFRLQASSPCIDAGVDVTSAYLGVAPDIGAYEYGDSPNIHYVKAAPDGDNSTGDGTIGNPWATVSYACTQAVTPGDTVYINAGSTITESAQIVRALGVHIYGAGNSSHIISTYTNASATQASIQCSSSSGTITYDGGSISYIRLTGSNLTAYYGINVGYRSHVSIHHVTLEDFLNGGIWLLASSSFGSLYATGNSITDCVINNSSGRTADRYPACIRITGQDSCNILNNTTDMTKRAVGQNGNTIEFQRCKHTRIDGNTFYRTDHELNYWNFFFEGWDYGGNFEYTNNIHYGLAKVSFGGEYNRQESDCTFGFKAIGNKFYNPRVGYRTVGGYAATIYCINVEGDAHINGTVHGNYIQNYGVGIELSTPESGVGYWHHYWDWDSVTVSANIIDGVGYQDHAYSYGIWMINESNLYPYYGVFNNIGILNNTIISNYGSGYDGYQGIGIYANDTVNNFRVINNISQGFSNYGIYISEHSTDTLVINGLDATYNCMNGNGTNTVYVENAPGRIVITDSDVTTGNITSDPLFRSSGYRLQATSPCINVGASVGLTRDYAGHIVPQQGGVDIGAYEYGTYYLRINNKMQKTPNDNLVVFH